MQHETLRIPFLLACAALALPLAVRDAAAGKTSEIAAIALAGYGGCECCLESRLEAARWMRSSDRAVPGFDAETGRDLLNYPPHRHVNYHHMRLEIDIPDMNTPRLSAAQTLTISPIAAPLEVLSLNASLLEISSVTVGGSKASFDHDGKALTITFDPPLAAGVRTDIVTNYSVDDPPFGLFWTPESRSWPGRAPQIHTQGQPEDNRYWFPMHDFPNVRLTTELLVTVPAGFQVISNGRLVSGPPLQQPGPSRAPDSIRAAEQERNTWHWLQDKPHVTYLVSLIVGQFDVVDVAQSNSQRGSRTAGRAKEGHHIAMPVFVPPGRAADVEGTYGRTPQMIDLFARLFDEPYPWHQYAQTVVWNFNFGGMENTGATTMHDTAILSPRELADDDIEGLISHEVAHQWFGNLITCNSWEHIWLNEGFATYLTNLWFEHREGTERGAAAGRDAYFHGVLGNFDRVINVDRADSPYQPAMASKVYDEPWDVFGRAANPYPKGAAILHMLRAKLGDELFFRSIAVYVDRHKNTSAETSDLRKALEDVSGENLEQFFSQWVFRPGVPHLDITLDWDRGTSALVVSVTQSQNIDGYNPAFEFSLPVWIQHRERNERTTVVSMAVHGRETTARFVLDAEPTMVVIDPEMTVLARTSIRQPVRRWVAQLERGPTLFARVRAARALSNRDSAVAAPVLLKEALNTRNHKRLRAEAARSLGRGGHTSALLELAGSRGGILNEPDLRLAMVEAAAQLAAREQVNSPHASQLKDLLVRHASAEEPSDRTRTAAITGLGRLGAEDHLRLIIAATDSDSQRDRLRQAALQALGQSGLPEALPIAVRYALPGTFNRTRPVAIAAITRLAEHDRESSFKVLTMVLQDRERRTWEAAASALVELGDPRAIEHLALLLETKRDDRDRQRVQAWLKELRTQIESTVAETDATELAPAQPGGSDAGR